MLIWRSNPPGFWLLSTTFDPRAHLAQLTPEQIVALVDVLSTQEVFLTVTETARYLKIPQQQLWRWRSKNIGPAYIELPGKANVRYRLSVLNAFMLVRQRQTFRMPRIARGGGLKRATGVDTRVPIAA